MDRDSSTPFHLKAFYRVGSHHRPDEFAFPSPPRPSSARSARSSPPPSPSTYLPSPYLTLHAWPTCTLSELSHLFVDALQSDTDLSGSSPTPSRSLAPGATSSETADGKHGPSSSTILPSPAVGTRLVFRLIYPDPASVRIQHQQRHWGDPSAGSSTARNGATQPHFTSRELGSVVIGGDGTGKIPAHPKQRSSGAVADGEETRMNFDGRERGGDEEADFEQPGSLGGDPDKTLAASRFVIGDYLSIAVLLPGRNGEVQPASAVRPPPSASTPMFSAGGGGGDGGPGRRFDADGYGDVGGGGRSNGWHASGPGGGGSRRRGPGGFGAADGGMDRVPRGDWRRGERLPPVEPRGYGSRGRRGGW